MSLVDNLTLAVRIDEVHRIFRRSQVLRTFAWLALPLALLAFLVGEVVAVARSAWWVARTVPALVRVLAVVAIVGWVRRDVWLAVPPTVVLVLLLAWPRIGPASWRDVFVQARVWRMRRVWRRVCRSAGLGWSASSPLRIRAADQAPRVIEASAVNAGRSVRFLLDLPPGQTVADLTKQAARVASAYRAQSATFTEAQPGRAILTLAMDTAARPAIAQVPDQWPETIAIGQTASDDPWRISTALHLLVAGVTGAGKGSIMWSGVKALAPEIASGRLRAYGVDMKGGMELEIGAGLFTELATDETQAVDMLETLARQMQARAKKMAGKSRKHVPTVDDPAILLVIDEMAYLTAYVRDRAIRQRIDSALQVLLSQGRAPGFVVWGFLQDPSKEVLGSRQLWPQRIALRMEEPTQMTMVLGDGARGEVQDIPTSEPGTGYFRNAETRELVRARADWVSDAEVRKIASRFPAPPVQAKSRMMGEQRVYFIRNSGTGQIKIGIAVDPNHRIKTLQTGSADRLELLGTMPGGRELESELHDRFAETRVGGEWFEPSGELADYIEEHAA